MCIIRPSYKHFVLQNILISAFFIMFIVTTYYIFKKYMPFILFFYIIILLIYLVIILIYRPLKFRNTIYIIKDSSVLISSGIIFRHKIYIPCSAIKYVAKKRNILQKISKNSNNIRSFFINFSQI